MSTDERLGRTEWEGLSPWDKAVQWRDAAPDIAEQVIALAISYAERDLAMQRDKISHDHEMATRNQCHRERMEIRTWWLDLISVIFAFTGLAGSLLVSWHYASAGHVIPGLGILGAGGAASAGAYALSRGIKRELNRVGRVEGRTSPPSDKFAHEFHS